MGQAVTIDSKGVHSKPADGTPTSLLGLPDLVAQGVEEALKAAGIRVTVSGPVEQEGGDVRPLASSGVRIDLELSGSAIPGFPPSLDPLPPLESPIPGAPSAEDLLVAAQANHIEAIEWAAGSSPSRRARPRPSSRCPFPDAPPLPSVAVGAPRRRSSGPPSPAPVGHAGPGSGAPRPRPTPRPPASPCQRHRRAGRPRADRPAVPRPGSGPRPCGAARHRLTRPLPLGGNVTDSDEPDVLVNGTPIDEREARLAEGADELATHASLGAGAQEHARRGRRCADHTGLTAILLAWFGAAQSTLVEEQIPYLISGGLLGLALAVDRRAHLLRPLAHRAGPARAGARGAPRRGPRRAHGRAPRLPRRTHPGGGERCPCSKPRVHVRFGEHQAVRDVSLAVDAGEIAGLIGPNGAGKTTLFNAVSGVQTLHGHGAPRRRRHLRLPPQQRARLGMNRTFQRLEVFGTMTAYDNIRTAAEIALVDGRGSMRGAPARADEIVDRARAAAASPTAGPIRCRPVRPAWSSSAGRSPPTRRSCSSTSPPRASTTSRPAGSAEVLDRAARRRAWPSCWSSTTSTS